MMMISTQRSAATLALTLTALAAHAQGQYAWDGAYIGLNAGSARNSACSSWTASGARVDSAVNTAFYNRRCGEDSGFVGGLQIGDNFQNERLIWGFNGELNTWSNGNTALNLKYTGAALPAGTYAFSGKLNPTRFALIGLRIGYAGDHWLPYLKAGGLITRGSRNSLLSYTPLSATKPTASFNGGANFASVGWVAGGGVELVLSGPWSLFADYVHAALGKGSNSAATCAGSASACTAFTGISFDTRHDNFTANIIRVGINYAFNY